MGHRSICCDGCGLTNFVGRRFKCLRCANFDLCGDCQDLGVCTNDHTEDHPMQLILDRRLRELHFAGENFDEIHLPNCYTCPYCGAVGHTAKRFIEHILAEHRHTDGVVICPMCAVMPSMDVLLMRNLWRHLQLMHTQHANLLDPSGPALRRSTARISRRARRRISAAATSMLNNDTEPAMDTLFQISTDSRRPTRTNELSAGASSARRVSVDCLDLFDETNVTIGTVASVIASNRRPPALLEPLNDNIAAVTECTSTASLSAAVVAIAECSANCSSREPEQSQGWLCPALTAAIAQTEALQHEAALIRIKRAAFLEHLLLSALCDDELALAAEPQAEPRAAKQSKARVGLQVEIQSVPTTPTFAKFSVLSNQTL